MSSRGRVDFRETPKGRSIMTQSRSSIGSSLQGWSQPGRLGRFASLKPCNAQYYRSGLDRRGQYRIVARQLCETRRQLRIGLGYRWCKPFGGKAVGLQKQYVYPDCRGAGCAELIDELCNQGARPRPLTESLQTYLVDGDDDRGRGVPFARRQFLVAVEPRKTHCTDDGHVLPQDRHEKQRKQGQTVTHAA